MMLSIVTTILVSFITLQILKDLMMIKGLLTKFIPHKTYFKSNKRPLVSVLLPVRNEAENIQTCLDSLAKQDYPKDQLEILVGNDSSTDNTAQLVQEFIDKYDNIRLIEIKKTDSPLKGKTNALAKLAQIAQGEYFLMTDGDMELPSTWANALVGEIREDNTGAVTGTTLVKDSPMQCSIYVDGMGTFKATSDMNAFTPGLGNNMAVSRQAYFDIGGYENMPFSIVEDYSLVKAIAQKGYQTKHILHDAALAKTLPMPHLKAILEQRKRWLKGAQEAPTITFLLAIFPYSLLSLFIALFTLQPQLAIGLFCLHACIKSTWLSLVKSKLPLLPENTLSKKHLLLYNIYFPIVSTLVFYYFILPTTVEWKDRPYEHL